jgi:prepilin-type N-terminal cleavage/methylation domain-containing protein
MNMTASRRQAFTIVELLVVVAIIGVLMALLLPAVQAARESGRRTACMNNLYQLGNAVNRFDQDAGKVPSWGNTVGSNATSWPVTLLPYIERNDLYESWLTSTPGNIVQVAQFRCPTAADPTPTNSGALAYAGNCGDGTNAANSKYNGVMPYPSVRYSLADIAEGDGVSTTLLFAEKTGSPGNVNQAFWAFNGSSFPSVFTGFQKNDANSKTQLPAFGISNGVFPEYGPSSQHVNGTCVGFCDGHTKFLAAGLHPAVYVQLVTSRDLRVTEQTFLDPAASYSVLPGYRAPPLSDGSY